MWQTKEFHLGETSRSSREQMNGLFLRVQGPGGAR